MSNLIDVPPAEGRYRHIEVSDKEGYFMFEKPSSYSRGGVTYLERFVLYRKAVSHKTVQWVLVILDEMDGVSAQNWEPGCGAKETHILASEHCSAESLFPPTSGWHIQYNCANRGGLSPVHVKVL